jgi:hypothetical protein
MKVDNLAFLSAKKDKRARALVVAHRYDDGKLGTYMYLCLDVKKPYTNETEMQFIYADTEMEIDSFAPHDEKRTVKDYCICFHCDILSWRGPSHIQTFLSRITAKSEIKFRVVAHNGSDSTKAHNLVHHTLYGIIDGKHCFLLSDYVGADNTASPVRNLM